MRLFERLFGGATSGDRAPEGGYYVYLRCNGLPHRPCGEPVRVRINPRTDLEEEYADEAADRIAGYTCHKDVLGNRCQNMMHLTIRYDRSRREVERQVEGATLLDRAEYEQGSGAP